MTIERIRELCHAEPFRSFTIHLPGGRLVQVEEPDFVALAPTGRLVAVYQPDDSETVMDVRLVSDITINPPGQTGPVTAQ